MRIASISKPITMAVVAKLWEAGQLDLDRPVGEYVPSWPKKEFKGEPVRTLIYRGATSPTVCRISYI